MDYFMNKNEFKTSVIIDKNIWDKFKYASKYDNRSASEQLRYLIQLYLKDFEKNIGEITPEDLLNL